MSHSFTVTPKKRLFRSAAPMTVHEGLMLVPGLTVFPLDPQAQAQLREQSLGDVVVLVGIEDESGRGFELSFESGAYSVREFTPATPEDWRLALSFLAALARHLRVGIEGEDGVTYTADTITDFDYRSEISFGIEAMARNTPSIMPGSIRPATFSPEMFAQIAAAESPVDAFGEMFTEIQAEWGYDATQRIMQSPEGEVIGAYVLGEGVRTVLPREPVLVGGHGQLRPADVSSWVLVLMLDDHGTGGVEQVAGVPYAEAIARLPQDRFHQLDGNQIVVHGLTADEIRALAG